MSATPLPASPAPAAAGSSRWRLLAAAIAPHRRGFVLVAIFALLGTGADLLSPLVYREAVNDIAGLFVGEPGSTGIDLLQSSEDDGAAPTAAAPDEREAHERGFVAPRTPDQALHTLLLAVGLLFAINVVSQLCILIADQRTVILASRIEAGLIQRAFRHVLRLPLAYFARRSSGSIAKQIDQTDQVAPIVTALAQQVAPEMIRMVGVIAIMLSQSWRLTLVAIALLPPYIWVVWRSAQRLEKGLADYYEQWDGVSGSIQDALGAVKTVKLAGAEYREADRLRLRSEEAYATYVARNRISNRYLFWQMVLSYLTQVLVLGYGGWLVFRHQLTPGDVVMFVAYLDRLYSPIETLTGLTTSLQDHFAAFARLTRLVNETPEPSAGGSLPEGPGRVQFEHVTFGYQPDRPVLHDVSFTLEPHRITALVGPSGAGKTTAADLLLRLFEPDGGSIRLDGASLATLDTALVRSVVAVVAADGAIFRATLRENLRYMRPDATDAEVLAAARLAGLDNLLQRLPEGLDTAIGERGVGLSVGERQRVQIARAIVARPRVMVLDEATANLDFATEAEIRGALQSNPGRPTTLVIAHRWAMVEHADHVVVLDGGRIVEQGTPAALAAGEGWFARFAAASRQPDSASVEALDDNEETEESA